jgi:transposase
VESVSCLPHATLPSLIIGGQVKKKGRRISMRKLKEAARLLLEFKLGVRQIARTCNISTSTAHAYVDRLKELDVPYGEIAAMGDDELGELLFPKEQRSSAKRLPDFEYLSKEMTKKGVTLLLLHEEYKKDNPGGYEQSRFYTLYREWAKKVDPVMRFTHKAGEKMFIDFSGDKAHYQDPTTGKIVEVELFISVLGASSYLYARAVSDQTTENFVNCTIKAFEFYGGCTEYVVPDNARSAVTHPSYYEPDINRVFAAMAEHYTIAVLPTRVRKPRDKAKVENGVLQAQRRILASLRNTTFFSLAELNKAIAEETKKLNERPMTGISKSRHDLFLEIDKPALRPLPQERYTLTAWKKGKVHIDYHIDVEKTHYSVPYTLLGQNVDISYTSSLVEIYHRGKRIASHMRVNKPGAFVTDKLHMPHSHRQYLEWTPERIKSWGEKIGLHTKLLMEAIMEHREHPEHGYRSCLGLIRLAKLYPPERVDQACKRACDLQAYNYKSVKALLERGLEKMSPEVKQKIIPLHSNVRGKNYYTEADHD